jgi:hypothetical protein
MPGSRTPTTRVTEGEDGSRGSDGQDARRHRARNLERGYGTRGGLGRRRLRFAGSHFDTGTHTTANGLHHGLRDRHARPGRHRHTGPVIAGGSNGTGAQSSTELFDPASGAFTTGPSMSVARIGPTAAALQNSYVLIVGGSNGSGMLHSAELYGPVPAG